MTIAIVIGSVLLLLALLAWWRLSVDRLPIDPRDQAEAERRLHEARQRLELHQIKQDIRRNVAAAERKLSRDLGLDE